MPTLEEYDAWKTKQQTADVNSTDFVLNNARKVNPDEFASDVKLGKAFGITPDLANAGRDMLQTRLDSLRNTSILRGSPRTAQWLKDANNARSAWDDVENMSWFEGAARGSRNALSRSGSRLNQAYNQYMLNQTAGRAQDRKMSFGEIIDSERGPIQTPAGEVRPWVNLSDLVSASARYLDARYADLIGTDDEAAARDYAGALGKSVEAMKSTPKSGIATQAEEAMFKEGASLGEVFQNIGTAFIQNPVGVLSWVAEVTGESAPQFALGVGTTIATRNPQAGIAVGLSANYATERFTSPADYLAEKGVDLTKAEGIDRLLGDPDLLKEANDRGIIRGMVITAFDAASLGLAGRVLSRNPIAEAVAQSVQQAVNGSFGEYAARKASGQEIDWNEIIAEGLAEIASTPFDMGMAGRRFIKERGEAQGAVDAKVLIDQLGDTSTSSKLRQRLDGSFMDFVGRATEGTPIEDIFVPAAKLQELFQSYRYDPAEFLAELPGVDVADWETALSTGGDVKIPTATYAAKIAGGEFDGFLRENMRFDPEAMTFAEAQEFNARASEIQMQAFEESEASRIAEESQRAIDVQELDDLVGRLRAAGRSTDVARFEAMPLIAMRRTMAERSGLTQEEFAQRYPLPEVRGAVPEGMKTKNVDELTRQLAEMRSYKPEPVDNGPSLLEAISEYGGINDVGGELKSRDAAVIKRGKGKKTLHLARSGVVDGIKDMFGGGSGKKHGIDDVAQAMIEAGYLRDNPVANEYRAAVENGTELPNIGNALLDAIDEELRGNVQYSGDVAVDERAAAIERNAAYLNELGVSLNDSDDVIRAALETAEKESGKVLGQGRRGSIQLPLGGAQDSAVIISLFESADLSTFIHESGHYFLAMLQDMATPPGVSADLVEMYTAVRGWWAENADAVAADAKVGSGLDVTADHVRSVLDNGTTGDAAIDAAVDIGVHEQFARGFEAYLMEGKAPSIELRSAFERFAQWLVRLYKNLRGLNVEVSPQMKAVFDRLLATDAEIEAARSDLSDEMLFAAAEAAGLNTEDYRHLVKLHDQAVEAANAKLRREVMAPIQRETEKWYREEKSKVRDEVSQQVNRMPVYRAWEWLGNRRWLGEESPEGMPDMRLDRQALVDRYGEGVLQTLPRGKFTVYANEGGMNPDEVAGWFGFDSGDGLVKALEQAPARKEAIDLEVDRVMRERHGDVLRDGQIEERALDAYHNDKQAQFLAAELKVLKARAGDTSADMTVAQAREAARITVSRMRVRDAIASNRFLTAERKAANEAIKLARLVERENLWSRQRRREVQAAVKDGSLRATNSATDRANASTDRYNDAVSRLVEQKRKQLLNHMLYNESVKAADEVEKAERFVSRLGKKSTRASLAGDYLEAIDELLERYDFRRVSARDEDRRGSLLNYIARMTAEGRENELSIPEEVVQNAQRRPYKQLTVDELRGVIDTLKNIEHTARLKQRLKDSKRERDLDVVVDDILAEFDENVKGDAPARAKSGRGGTKEGFRSYLNLVKTADTILREIDGFKDGAAYRHIKAPIDDAVNDLTIKRREAGEKFEQLYSVYSKEERRKMTTLQSIPELNGQFSKWDLISLALNVGNEGNYQRLTDNKVKGHFQPGQIEVAISRLDERDWKFVQSAWDFIDGYWPEIEAREKRVTGVAPEKIAPREVQTKFGTFKGGYYPLKYDAELSSLARDDDLHDLAASMTGGRFGKAQTKNGHTKERSNSSGRPVLIDLGVLHGHVNQVIHDLALSEVVANSWRILQNNEVKSAFLDRGMKSDFDALEVWLQDVASGEVRGADFMNRWSRKLKSGFTVSKLAFNLTTVLLQPTGLAQSFVVVGKKDMLLGIQDVFRRPLSGPGSAASIIIDKSPFMRERETTFNKDIYDILGDTKTGPSQNRVSQFTSEYLAPWGFWLMQKAQFYTVDMPTWLAGYRQATEQGKSEADAIAYADRIVARAAASGNFSDRTPIERGSLSRNVRQNDVVRLFTALGSYMFAKFNVAYEKTRQTQFNDPRQVLSWTSDMVMLFTVEAILAAAVRGQLPWGDDDDDEDGWAEFLAKQTALSAAGTLPFIRDIASGVQGFSGGGAYGSIMDTIARPIFQASQGEVDKAFVRSLVDAGGLFLHIPSTQINRFIDATWRQTEGEDVSPIEYIMGKSK
ncbi:hypothetical protein [Rhizobium sp.]|uniref:hypothetical protein n=1 Tax=Rhizobium sp. TaxID=391 RepID=UPI0028B05676